MIDLKDIKRAQKLINEYCQEEFGDDADFSNLSSIGIAYTTVEDREDLGIQVNVNLMDLYIDRTCGGVLVERLRFKNMNEMCKMLELLDFNELVYFSEDQIEWVEKQLNTKG